MKTTAKRVALLVFLFYITTGNVSGATSYSWTGPNGFTATTQSISISTTTYDTSSLMSSFANPFKDKTGFDYLAEDFPFVNKVLVENEFNYDANTSSYSNSGRTTYNYNSAILLATEKFDTENAAISVYPNPTKNQVNFQFPNNQMAESIIILDITGKIMLTQSNNSNQVDVSQLANGMYIIKANSEGKIFTNKFIKE